MPAYQKMDYITGKLKTRDQFGQSFGLTYKGATSYKTWFGSLATTILNVLLLFYACVLFLKVYTNSATALNVDKTWFDIQNPKEEGFNPGKAGANQEGFNLGVGFLADMPESIGSWEFDYSKESERKYDTKAKKWNYKIEEKPTLPVESERCGDGESFESWKSTFKTATENKDTVETAQECLDREEREKELAKEWTFQNLRCGNIFNNNLTGNQFSKNYNHMAIKLKKCISDGKNKCASETEVTEYFAQNELYIIYKDMFTDIDDPIQPVKYYINQRISTGLKTGSAKNFDFFVQQGSLKRSWLLSAWLDPIFAMGDFREYETSIVGNPDDQNYLNILVKLDDTKVHVKRQEYTFDMWFIAIGGLERVWSTILGKMVGAVTKPLMINSFLGALFLMKNNRDKEDIDDSSDPEADNYHGHRPAYGNKHLTDIQQSNVYEKNNKGFNKAGAIYMRPKTFITKNESKHYQEMDNELRDKTKKISPTTINRIVSHLIKNRTAFHAQLDPKFLFHAWHKNTFKRCCIKKLRPDAPNLEEDDKLSPSENQNIRCINLFKPKDRKYDMQTDHDDISEYKRQKLYVNGVAKYNKEMDLVQLLKTIRQVKVYFRTMLKEKQRTLLMMQREEVIDSASQVSSDADFALDQAMVDMKSTVPLQRMFAMGRIKRALKNYQDDDPTRIQPFDRNLLKGFYTKDKWELVNDSEKESLKFSAKIDRGRALGLIKHYWKNRDMKNTSIIDSGINDNREYAHALFRQKNKHAENKKEQNGENRLQYSNSFRKHIQRKGTGKIRKIKDTWEDKLDEDLVVNDQHVISDQTIISNAGKIHPITDEMNEKQTLIKQ